MNEVREGSREREKESLDAQKTKSHSEEGLEGPPSTSCCAQMPSAETRHDSRSEKCDGMSVVRCDVSQAMPTFELPL